MAFFPAPQLFIGRGELRGSLRDASIEFARDMLLFAQKPRPLQPDGRLIRGYAQNQSLGLPREIRSLRPCNDFANFALQPQSQEHDRNVSASNRVSVSAEAIPEGRPPTSV